MTQRPIGYVHAPSMHDGTQLHDNDNNAQSNQGESGLENGGIVNLMWTLDPKPEVN